MKPLLLLACLTVLVADGPTGYVFVTTTSVTPLGAGVHELSGPEPLQDVPPIWLPAGRSACASLGLNAAVSGDCTFTTMLDASARQTDQSLWFGKVSSAIGPAAPDCDGPVAIQTYLTAGGRTGTSYLCRTVDADDRITATELAAVRSGVQLDHATPVTFGIQQSAEALKRLVRFYASHEAP